MRLFIHQKVILAKTQRIVYNIIYLNFILAGVMELVDVADSKSADGDIVGVRVPPPAPHRRSKRHIACSDFFQQAKNTHFAAPPLHPATASLGCRVVLPTPSTLASGSAVDLRTLTETLVLWHKAFIPSFSKSFQQQNQTPLGVPSQAHRCKTEESALQSQPRAGISLPGTAPKPLRPR